MHEGSTNRFSASGSAPRPCVDAKSLFRNILPRKSLRLKILARSPPTPRPQTLRNEYFTETREKNVAGISPSTRLPLIEGHLGCSVHRCQQKRVVGSALRSVASDLSGIVNGIGVDQHPAGVRRNQRIQVLHPSRGGPDRGMRRVVRQVAVTHDHAGVVHTERNAVGSAGKGSQILNLVGRVPQNSMPTAARAAAVGLADDNAGSIDGVGDARYAAGESAQILHRRTIPQEAVRGERRTVAEYGFAYDLAAVVDGQSGSEDRFGQGAQVLYFLAGPTCGIDDTAAEEGVAGDFARGVDLKRGAGRAS